MKAGAARAQGDYGGITPLMVSVLAVLVLAIWQWLSGPIAFSVDRVRATTAADATALAAVGWNDDLAQRVALANGAQLERLSRVASSRGATVEVTVTIGGVAARALASDLGPLPD